MLQHYAKGLNLSICYMASTIQVTIYETGYSTRDFSGLVSFKFSANRRRVAALGEDNSTI